MVNNNLVQLFKYGKEFIFPLKHHSQRTEEGVQYIATFQVRGISEEEYSTHVSLVSINTSPTNCNILKQVEGRKIKGNRNMPSGFSDNMHYLSHQSKRQASSGAGKMRSIVYPII